MSNWAQRAVSWAWCLCMCCLQCRTQLDPAPHIIIASSDSDMQQLLDGNTYWLQLLQVRADCC